MEKQTLCHFSCLLFFLFRRLLALLPSNLCKTSQTNSTTTHLCEWRGTICCHSWRCCPSFRSPFSNKLEIPSRDGSAKHFPVIFYTGIPRKGFLLLPFVPWQWTEHAACAEFPLSSSFQSTDSSVSQLQRLSQLAPNWSRNCFSSPPLHRKERLRDQFHFLKRNFQCYDLLYFITVRKKKPKSLWCNIQNAVVLNPVYHLFLEKQILSRAGNQQDAVNHRSNHQGTEFNNLYNISAQHQMESRESEVHLHQWGTRNCFKQGEFGLQRQIGASLRYTFRLWTRQGAFQNQTTHLFWRTVLILLICHLPTLWWPSWLLDAGFYRRPAHIILKVLRRLFCSLCLETNLQFQVSLRKVCFFHWKLLLCINQSLLLPILHTVPLPILLTVFLFLGAAFQVYVSLSHQRANVYQRGAFPRKPFRIRAQA